MTDRSLRSKKIAVTNPNFASCATPLPPVFHVYNRANDRQTLFTEDRDYDRFMAKVSSVLPNAASLLAYCVMPNHFHLLLSPHHDLVVDLRYDDKPLKRLPTKELSDAMQRILMGFVKGYNLKRDLTGSRFQKQTKCKHHTRSIAFGMQYIHQNPVKANLVDHPSEWGYSSYNEYAGLIDRADCLCDRALAMKFLLARPLYTPNLYLGALTE